MDDLRAAAQSVVQPEFHLLFRSHPRQLLLNRLQHTNGGQVGFQDDIQLNSTTSLARITLQQPVKMFLCVEASHLESFVLTPVHVLFIRSLLGADEGRVLRPGGEGNPGIIQHLMHPQRTSFSIKTRVI